MAVSTSFASLPMAGSTSTAPSAVTSSTSSAIRKRATSKSWMVMSMKSPPDSRRYSIGPGWGSRLVTRTSRGRPMRPARTWSRAWRKLRSKRRWKPTCRVVPARATASSARSITARSVATGFSQKTCLPAAAAAWISWAWVGVGEAITTASTAPSASSSSGPAWPVPTSPTPSGPPSATGNASRDQRPRQARHRRVRPFRRDGAEQLQREHAVVAAFKQGAVEAVERQHALAGQDAVLVGEAGELAGGGVVDVHQRDPGRVAGAQLREAAAAERPVEGVDHHRTRVHCQGAGQRAHRRPGKAHELEGQLGALPAAGLGQRRHRLLEPVAPPAGHADHVGRAARRRLSSLPKCLLAQVPLARALQVVDRERPQPARLEAPAQVGDAFQLGRAQLDQPEAGPGRRAELLVEAAGAERGPVEGDLHGYFSLITPKVRPATR